MAVFSGSAATARVEVAASAEDCWRAWTQPAVLTGWYPERVEGELEGDGEVELAWDSLGQSISLQVLEASPPRRLVLRGQPPNRPPQRQEVLIRDRGTAAEVEITHRGFRDGPGGADERAGTEAGWRAALATLKLYLERYPGRSRSAAAALGTAVSDPGAGFEALARETGLGPNPIPGGSVRLAPHGGPRYRGEVLVAAPPYQLLVSLPELEAALALRAFTSGAADAPEIAILAAQMWSWSSDQTALDALRPAIEASVDRVVQSLGGPAAQA
jgi:uncharacterized protein YndB with AHSA1/START domain